MSLVNIESQTKKEVQEIILKEIGKENLDKIDNIFKNGFKHDNLKVKLENINLTGMGMLYLDFSYSEDNVLIEGTFHKSTSALSCCDKSINLYITNEKNELTRLVRIYNSSFGKEKNPLKEIGTQVFDIYDEEFDIRLNENSFVKFAEKNILKTPLSSKVQESLLMFFFNMEELANNFSFENLNEGYVKVDRDYLSIKFLISDSFYVPNLSTKSNKNTIKNS